MNGAPGSGAASADSASGAQRGQPRERTPEGFERGRGGGSVLFGLLEVMQSALIIGVVVAVVVLGHVS